MPIVFPRRDRVIQGDIVHTITKRPGLSGRAEVLRILPREHFENSYLVRFLDVFQAGSGAIKRTGVPGTGTFIMWISDQDIVAIETDTFVQSSTHLVNKYDV